ncbi:hypothetical protein BCR35DRAFT_311362 [Leucosporidium creatinivorum]|uniref:Uncharacterized protein n=1 Tax=Leucosporidium creatinivorum TaxID=106004 RepID=A0A1Y2C2A7_9BASI|nr:hypothetical protein BCR35DRAFT_311362 [Leucosporidium creatinivorum]
MTDKDKDKYSSLSASSLLDLKGLVSQKESEFASSRHLGTHSTGIQRPSSKATPWLKQNKGLKDRQERDRIVYEQEGKVQGKDPKQVRDKLEKKAKLYDKIKKGKSAGLTEAQISNLLVDFDARSSGSDTDSDEDESSTVPIAGPSDPLVEWTDEFGRTRLIPRSEIPRGTAVATEEEPELSNVHYGDQHHFPVYTPDPSLLAARRAAVEAQAPLVQHYDSTLENRQRGAGFMAFSKDEEEREAQMMALREERKETERKRKEVESGGGVMGERERERETRKRKVEEKRKELELKRRKVVGDKDGGAER